MTTLTEILKQKRIANDSIFQGWKEVEKVIQFENKGGGIWSVYEFESDPFGGSYVYAGVVRMPQEPSLRELLIEWSKNIL